MIPVETALPWVFAIAATVFLCRLLPFIVFRNADERRLDESKDNRIDKNLDDRSRGFLGFIEKVAPPVCMTVLAFNALASPLKTAFEKFAYGPAFNAEALTGVLPLLAASALTAALHLWKRNALLSICGGTALFMVLSKGGAS